MKVRSLPIWYFAYKPVADMYESSVDPVHIPMGFCTQPVTLAGKLIRFLAREDECKYITDHLSTIGVQAAFNSAVLRVHESLIAFVNNRTIRSDLVMFDYTTKHSVLIRRLEGFPSLYLEASWVMQTKKEDVYIEMCTRLIKSSIKVPWTKRVHNWFTKKGTTSKLIPSLRYVITIKVFNTPASCYTIDVHQFDIEVPYSESAVIASDLDLYKDDKLSQRQKERYESRKTYFRQH